MAEKSSFPALELQRQIYVEGMSGKKPLIPLDIQKLEQKAKEKMSPEAFAYVAGGAGIEDTIRNNRSGFGNWKIIPRMLRDEDFMRFFLYNLLSRNP